MCNPRLPCVIKRKVRNNENNGIDQQRDRGGPAERRILAAMMQGVLQPSSISPECINNRQDIHILARNNCNAVQNITYSSCDPLRTPAGHV